MNYFPVEWIRFSNILNATENSQNQVPGRITHYHQKEFILKDLRSNVAEKVYDNNNEIRANKYFGYAILKLISN